MLLTPLLAPVQNGGPTQYLSKTTFFCCSPPLLRDFYMDDEYRGAWDSSLASARQLELCRETGVEVGHWVKKLPLFGANRDYVLAWRVWEDSKGNFYSVTKVRGERCLAAWLSPRSTLLLSALCRLCLHRHGSLCVCVLLRFLSSAFIYIIIQPSSWRFAIIFSSFELNTISKFALLLSSFLALSREWVDWHVIHTSWKPSKRSASWQEFETMFVYVPAGLPTSLSAPRLQYKTN
jgi:hypothetical protein